MKVLVACEYSAVVRSAFEARGHYAMSCDLLPTDVPGLHYQGDILDLLDEHWDLMIAHPPCTHLASSGARWFKDKQVEQAEAVEFVKTLLNAPIEMIALENPIGVLSSKVRKPDQIVQPWMFGHPETKATCLWLKGLPLLVPTNNVKKEMEALPAKDRHRVHYMSPGPDRWKARSTTYAGLAEAMAEQWIAPDWEEPAGDR